MLVKQLWQGWKVMLYLQKFPTDDSTFHNCSFSREKERFFICGSVLSCLQIKASCNVNPLHNQDIVLSYGQEVAIYRVVYLPKELLYACKYVVVLILFFWGHSQYLPKEGMREKNLVSSIHLRFLFLKKWQNLMYKKKQYLFSFTDTSWRDPLLLPVWSPGWKICLTPFCLEVRAAFSEGHELLRWLGQVSTGHSSKLFCSSEHLPEAISTLAIRYGPCLLGYGSLILWLSPFTSASCLALGWMSGAPLAGQTHGAHESSECEISS